MGDSRYHLDVLVGVRSRVIPPVGEQSCASAHFERGYHGMLSRFSLGAHLMLCRIFSLLGVVNLLRRLQ